MIKCLSLTIYTMYNNKNGNYSRIIRDGQTEWLEGGVLVFLLLFIARHSTNSMFYHKSRVELLSGKFECAFMELEINTWRWYDV